MRDYLTIGSTPCDEPCVQVLRGEKYFPMMKKEAEVFKRQLERQFPDAPDGTYFGLKSFPHDFGSYIEVCVFYDNEDEESYDFALMVENNTPNHWDADAYVDLENIGDYWAYIRNQRG